MNAQQKTTGIGPAAWDDESVQGAIVIWRCILVDSSLRLPSNIDVAGG
jgi:hypothetical protein